MAFTPSSTIYLCNVPFDNTYKNQIWFPSVAQQRSYFSNKVKKTFSNYLTVRESLPDGGTRSIIRVEANIDELRSLYVNYVYYMNANSSTKYFYAFITEMIYVNDGLTKLVVETDVYQTWLFDVTLLDSYVIREHSATDEIGDNVVPEKFDFEDYNYTNLGNISELTTWGYLIVASERLVAAAPRGVLHSGVYQGLYFYYAKTSSQINGILDSLEETGSDCILSITLVPDFCLNNSAIGIDENTDVGVTSGVEGQVWVSTSPASLTHELSLSSYAFSFDGYTPKNNKLFTSPFTKLIVSNHAGEEAEYTVEDFSDPKNPSFTVWGDISTTPSVMLYPKNYKHLTNAVDFSISLSGFPQCSFNNDTFKLWMAKNYPQLGVNIGSGLLMMAAAAIPFLPAAGLSTLGGAAGFAASMHLDYAASAAIASGGIDRVHGSMQQIHAARLEPNKATVGNVRNNLLTAIGQNTFSFYMRHIKKNYAQTVDDFFTMYGYQTNRIKKPNVSARPYFNYVQLAEANIRGGIPTDDMQQLKAIYERGVTLWKSNATVGDYSVDNSPAG